MRSNNSTHVSLTLSLLLGFPNYIAHLHHACLVASPSYKKLKNIEKLKQCSCSWSPRKSFWIKLVIYTQNTNVWTGPVTSKSTTSATGKSLLQECYKVFQDPPARDNLVLHKLWVTRSYLTEGSTDVLKTKSKSLLLLYFAIFIVTFTTATSKTKP